MVPHSTSDGMEMEVVGLTDSSVVYYTTILYYTTLHYTTLYYSTLHYTTLHYSPTLLDECWSYPLLKSKLLTGSWEI